MTCRRGEGPTGGDAACAVGSAGGAADKRARRVSWGSAPLGGGPGRGAGRSETGRALAALSARRWAEHGKGRDARPTGRDRAAGERGRGKAGPAWKKSGLGWFGCWAGFSFSISISSLFFFSLFKLNSNYIYSNSNSKFEFNNLMHTSK